MSGAIWLRRGLSYLGGPLLVSSWNESPYSGFPLVLGKSPTLATRTSSGIELTHLKSRITPSNFSMGILKAFPSFVGRPGAGTGSFGWCESDRTNIPETHFALLTSKATRCPTTCG